MERFNVKITEISCGGGILEVLRPTCNHKKPCKHRQWQLAPIRQWLFLLKLQTAQAALVRPYPVAGNFPRKPKT